MKLPTYSSTPRLDHYPRRDRFAVYRATHKRLLLEDAAYRRQWTSYVLGIVCVATIPISGSIAGGTVGIVISALGLVGALAGVLHLAFRQQCFMNKRIGDALQQPVA